MRRLGALFAAITLLLAPGAALALSTAIVPYHQNPPAAPGLYTYFFVTTQQLLDAFSYQNVLPDGTQAIVDANAFEGDNVWGVYYYYAADTTSADNGTTIRVDNALRRWYLLPNGGSFSGTLGVGQGGLGQTNPTAHAVIVGEGTSPTSAIGPGSASLCFVSNGASADPSFQSCPGGGAVSVTAANAGIVVSPSPITGTGTVGLTNVRPIRYITSGATQTANASDYLIGFKLGSPAAITLTLDTSPATGELHIIKDEACNGATDNITVTPAAGTIDGQSTFVMNQNCQAINLEYDGTQWEVF